MKLKNLMEKDGYHLNVVIYNTIIHGFFKEGELHEANKIFTDMKAMDVAPNTFSEGKTSATSKPPASSIASLIIDMNASWSLHFLPNAALEVMPLVIEKISVLRLINDPIDEEMDWTRFDTSSSLTERND
ncbi:hypothetical protein HHK36_031585 [Tetracentron sinense]|uniref:Pentatricopeptide repeat-containing protein n=1 Tax=Tetracentron sinense TaxID=13715 RepID=A0A834YA45_TETSI|nr:hypothetical protein HHK36_031585 [Tetracentron sinense]